MPKLALRTWATPLTMGAFLLMSTTGVLMFFKRNPGLITVVHETSWGAAWDAAKDNGWDQLSDWAKDQPIDQAKDNALGILGKSLVPGTSFGQALQDQLDEDLEPYKSAAEAVRSALGGRESNETDASKER
jgi:hypothetical protein